MTFVRLPWERKRLALEAILVLLDARMLVWRHGEYGALRTVGDLSPTDDNSTSASGDAQAAIAREIAWAITVVPPVLRRRHKCLIEALGAARLLTRRSVPWVLKVGVASGKNAPLAAHAWLIAGGRVVTGWVEARGFTQLMVYRSRG